MFKEIYYRFRYRAYFRHRQGKARYASLALTSLLHQAKEDLKKLRSDMRNRLLAIATSNEVLSQKQRKLPDLGRTEDESHRAPYMREEEEAIKRKAKFNFKLVIALGLIEATLNYFSMLIIIPGEGALLEVARVLIALGVTFGAMFVFDKTIVTWHRAIEGGGRIVGPLICSPLSVLAIWALYTVSSPRAKDLEGGATGFIYYGFMALSFVFPLLGGWLWAERELVLPKYRRLKMWKQTMAEIHDMESKIAAWKTQNQQSLKEAQEHFSKLTYGYWGGINYFNVLKDNYNDRVTPPIVEDVTGTIAESFDRFSTEAQRVYDEEVRQLYKGVIESAGMENVISSSVPGAAAEAVQQLPGEANRGAAQGSTA